VVTAQPGEWEGTPDQIDGYTPVRVRFENNGDRPVRVRYTDFQLTAGDSTITPVDPRAIDVSGELPAAERARRERARETGGGIALDIAVGGAGETIESEKILVASGRAPNTADLGLESVGIELSSNQGIKVDDRLRSTNPDIYAAGDVTGRDQFVYMAAYGAKLAARNALNGNSEQYDATAMPAVTFSDPQVATPLRPRGSRSRRRYCRSTMCLVRWRPAIHVD